jgi:hypothetical protein
VGGLLSSFALEALRSTVPQLAMTAEKPDPTQYGRVVPLRPRMPPAVNDNQAPSSGREADSPEVGDLRRFERDGHDDYRHRMLMNAAAFIVCTLLVLAGIWLATRLAQMQKDQDCVLSGRRGCTPVDVPARSRW